MKESLKNLFSKVKEQAEIIDETVRIEIWKKLHRKKYLEMKKRFNRTHPEVITIYKDKPVVEAQTQNYRDYQPTEEEIREIEQSLRAKTEEYRRMNSQTEGES